MNKKQPGCRTLLEKTHRLTCYFLERTIRMIISPLSNVSKTPGCEGFAPLFDEGFEKITNDYGTPEAKVEN